MSLFYTSCIHVNHTTCCKRLYNYKDIINYDYYLPNSQLHVVIVIFFSIQSIYNKVTSIVFTLYPVWLRLIKAISVVRFGWSLKRQCLLSGLVETYQLKAIYVVRFGLGLKCSILCYVWFGLIKTMSVVRYTVMYMYIKL